MLQIKLSNKATPAEGGAAKLLSGETVNVACPDHLVLAELPVAKSLGSTNAASRVKIVGRRSRRPAGERVHVCVRCDFPIAIYGRLSPCEHAYCLDCARSDSICHVCEQRIEGIKTIKMMEGGIFICAACYKSFLKKDELKSHIQTEHADLIGPKPQVDGNDQEVVSAKKPTASDSTVQGPPKPVSWTGTNSQVQDRDDKPHWPPPRDQPPTLRPAITPPISGQPFPGQIVNQPLELKNENRPPGFDVQPSGGAQQGILSETPYPAYPLNPLQPPGYPVQMNPNMVLPQPPYAFRPFAPDATQQLFLAPGSQESGTEQGSLLGFPAGPGAMNVGFPVNYSPAWNMGPNGAPFDPSLMMNQGTGNLNHPSMPNRGMEPMQSGTSADSRDGKGILAQQAFPSMPPPMGTPQMSQMQGNFFPHQTGHDGQSF